MFKHIMTLLVKILLFAVVAFIANIKGVITSIKKTLVSFGFYKERPKKLERIIENESRNNCKNKQNFMTYSS